MATAVQELESTREVHETFLPSLPHQTHNPLPIQIPVKIKE